METTELLDGDVRTLKVHLEPRLAASRFRLRLLRQGDLLEDCQKLSDLGLFLDLQVVILQFCEAAAEEVQALLAASREDLAERMEMLLEQPLDPNLADDDGDTPLATAARNGSSDCARLLLEAGADRDRAFRGASPLWLAAARRHAETVRVLVHASADIDLTYEGASPLWFAARKGHVDVVQLLLQAGANKEKTGISGSSPLWIAAAKGHLEVVRLLLHSDADMEKTPYLGTTPIQISIARGHLEVARLLQGTKEVDLDEESAAEPGFGYLDAERLLQKAARDAPGGIQSSAFRVALKRPRRHWAL